MRTPWRRGAPMGRKKIEAVHAGAVGSTMTARDIASGRPIAEVGIAPL